MDSGILAFDASERTASNSAWFMSSYDRMSTSFKSIDDPAHDGHDRLRFYSRES